MESVKYEGVYPCMHNHSLIIVKKAFFDFKEKNFLVCSFESWSGWKKRKAEKGIKNQLSYKTTVEADNNFNDVFKGNIMTVV
jgi:hypothetical protein